MRRWNTRVLVGIAILAVLSLLVIWPRDPAKYLGGLPLPGSPGLRFDFAGWRLERDGMRLGLDLQGGTRLVLQGDMTGVPEAERDQRIRGAQHIIERRVNAFGVAEPIVQTVGQDRVLVELAGIRDIEQAKSLIGKTARLDFREDLNYPNSPPDWVIAKARGVDGQEKELTGEYFRNAEVSFDQRTRAPQILFHFNDEGARMFGELTTRLVGKPLGIFLDNQVLTDPIVREPITGGDGTITGRFTLQEVKDLVVQLNAGALPVPVQIVEERTVDATLGGDSVRKSVVAGELGLLVIAAFMIALYRVPGVMAVLALAVYTLVTLALFKLWPVTLTLAGIAGFILSIGMAVDANILVFERMREELRAGKTVFNAMEVGFQRAWPSIRDSNVSTLLTCAILYWFGSNFGASIIVGFAVTLALGVLVSMFSAIFVTRSFLRALANWQSVSQPSLFGVVPVPAGAMVTQPLEIVKHRYVFLGLSTLALLPGLVSLLLPGGIHPGIDFSSGSTMTLRFAQPVEQGALRQAFAELGHHEAVVQRSEDVYLVRTFPLATEERDAAGVVTRPSERQTVEQVLSERFGGVEVLSFDSVSPLIAAEIVQKSTLAVVVACFGILAYLSFAFRKVRNPWRYGACAVLALVQVALLVLGVFSLLGRVVGLELDALFITALLTVIGFSVHDTIVVFDRIRENLSRYVGEPFNTVVNHSHTQTLGRSLSTSLTVILTLSTLLLFGGVTIRPFVLALLIGIAAGTYASIFNASMLLVLWENGEFGRLFGRGSRAPSAASAPIPAQH
jgi:SecD/SecF fusion protein